MIGGVLSRPYSRVPRSFRSFPDEESRILFFARVVWFLAANSSLCAPQMLGNSSNFDSDAELRHYQLSAPSSRIPVASFSPVQECSNIVFNHDDQLSASSSGTPNVKTFPAPWKESSGASVFSSWIHAAMLPPLANLTDVMKIRMGRAGMLTETSAFNSETHPSAYVPLRDDSMLAHAFAELSLGRPGSKQMDLQALMQNIVSQQELGKNNHGTPAARVIPLRRPRSEQFTPQMPMQNREVLPAVDINGERPASELDRIKGKFLRLNVASMVAQDGLKSAVGLLIRDFRTAQFISASCSLMILRTEPSLLFAAACCEGIRFALPHGSHDEPTTVVLESHLLSLLNPLYFAQHEPPLVAEFKALQSLETSHFRIRYIPEESNGAACQLALHALQMEAPKMVWKDPPDWLVPYLISEVSYS